MNTTVRPMLSDVETVDWFNESAVRLDATNESNWKPSDKDYAFVWIYLSPLILLIGVTGNVLTLCVMGRRRLRGTSTSVYLSAMAVTDTLALLCRIPPEFFEACETFIFSELNRWTCKLEKFSFYTVSDAAIWILVVFTLDRLIAVRYPLRKHTMCAPRRAVLVCSIVFTLAISKNIHVFWTRDNEFDKNTGKLKRVCGRPEPFRDFEDEVRPWIAFVLVSLVPFVLIVLSNILIVQKLVQAHQVRHSALSVHRSGAASNGRDYSDTDDSRCTPVTSSVPAKSPVFSQTSMMCLAVSLSFLVCVTPSIVLTIGREQWKTESGYYIARVISHQLSCINHAVNFFLYCFTGQRFRDELVGLLNRRRSSSSTFSASTRRYYLDNIARRSTPTSTSILAMQSLSMSTVPVPVIAEVSEDEKDSF